MPPPIEDELKRMQDKLKRIDLEDFGGGVLDTSSPHGDRLGRLQREMQRAPRPHRAAFDELRRGDEDELGPLLQYLADLHRLTLAHRGEEVLGLL